MVAAVTVSKGKAEMAYVGEKPWHGLGQSLTPGMPLEVWSREAGMNWKVQRSKIRYATGKNDTSLREWPEQHVLFRSDSKAPLGLVSEGFKIVQPGECLEFFRELVEKNHFQLETAGTLFGGRRYWAMAKTGHKVSLDGSKDLIGGYLLMATAADGSMSTTVKFTSVRVVCNNTLTAALGGHSKNAIKVRHSSVFSETEVKLELGLIDETWAAFGQQVKAMAKVKLSKKDALGLLIDVMGDPAQLAIDTAKVGREKALEAQPNMRGMASILALFDGAGRGADLPSSKGTGWGLVNATSEFYDHFYGRDPSRRLSKAWFGKNDIVKTKVAEAVLVRT